IRRLHYQLRVTRILGPPAGLTDLPGSTDFHPSAPVFFFIRRPQPRSTLFPYTTLFRSLADRIVAEDILVWPSVTGPARGRAIARSEEHTSELQSRGHLVCRLLLEKKKKNHHTSH